MPQIKISLNQSHFNFVQAHGLYDFSNQSAMIEAAVAQFRRSLLSKSAECYEEIYTNDMELQELTDNVSPYV